MLSGIANWVEDKATGYLRTGIQAGGTLAGNAVGGVGSLVENAGKTAASGVQGGIGGVGSYINGYGETIKRSMSADGPVSSTQKKTAVKPSTPGAKPPPAQKAIGSAPSSKKALPAPSQKPAPKPPAARANPAQKSASSAKPPQSKVGGPTAAKSQGPVGVSRPPSKPIPNAQKMASSTNSSGKVVVSAQSRPGARKPAVGRGATPAKTTDFVGIGDKTNNTQSKGSSGAARKPSASDPLAMGDLENIGKKK